MKELVQTLVETYGPSGQEGRVRRLIEERIGGVAQVRTDALGNLIAFKQGSGGGCKVMVAAHMDEIGLIITHVDEKGFLRFARIGGVSPATLIGGRVRFAQGALGVIAWEKWLRSNDKPEWKELFIDVGATSPKDSPVGVGDVGAFERSFAEMGDRLVAKAMDDRIGCAIALQTLLEMESSPNDVYFVFTVQEEVGTRGAAVSAFGLEPDVAVAVDVTGTGDTPEAHPMAVSLGAGPAIKIMDSGMLTHPAVKEWMIGAAEGLGIPHQLEVLELGSTDARAMQLSRSGVPAGCLSVPCRYIHTPSEVVDYRDVQGAVALLKKMVSEAVPAEVTAAKRQTV
ncbi:MAG: M20/M25/M40 family metallo-hydrolase [Chloroflexi bacterium]|nr:M20/M25/M40 family metallo-hydrolase [Chloroflexota bacterium]